MPKTLTETLEANKVNLSFSRENLRAKVEELLCQPLLPAEQQKVLETLKEFVAMDFIYQLAQRYPLISSRIFDLRGAESKVEREGYGSREEYTLELPLVVSLPLDKCTEGEQVKTSAKGIGKKDSYGHKSERMFEVSCSIPEITPEARSALSEAIKFSAELTAKAYQDELLSRILLVDKMDKKNINGPLSADYSLVWAPSAWNIKAIERDPAIFMKYYKRNLLVYRWDIPEENSLDAILGEFREELKMPD